MSANWEQERDAIDRGLRGDKIPVADPAAAPLGADEQAADARTPAEHIAPAWSLATGPPSSDDLVPFAAIGAVAAITAAALVAPLF